MTRGLMENAGLKTQLAAALEEGDGFNIQSGKGLLNEGLRQDFTSTRGKNSQ